MNDDARLAAEAHSDLNIFHGIIAICEGGTLHAPSHAAAQRIIGICKTEAGKRLRDFDRHMARVKDADDE